MAKLARVFDFGWDVGKSLDQIFTDPSGMKSRATSCQDDTTDVAKLRRRHIQAAQLCGAFVRVEATAHCVSHGVRLLKNFLEHVMRIVTFPDIFGGEFDFADWMLGAVSCKRGDLELVSPRRDHIEVV